MKNSIQMGLAAALLVAGAGVAHAQETSFRGFRAEGQIGWDRFQSQGDHHDKLGYGGAVGFDGVIHDRFVVGAEGSFWRANKWSQNCTGGVVGGTVCTKSFEEWGAAARAGYLVTPKVLVYGKGGYVNNEQRKFFAAPPGETSYYNHYRTDGYQVGGGVEYSLNDNFYVNTEYRYAGYADHTARQRVLVGFGVRFKP